MVDPYMSVNMHLVMAAHRLNEVARCRPALREEHETLVRDIVALTDLVDDLDALAAKPEVLA